MIVKFSTLRGGVFIEQTGVMEYTGKERCFRFDKKGNSEYAILSDLKSNNPHPRWFHHQFKETDFTFV